MRRRVLAATAVLTGTLGWAVAAPTSAVATPASAVAARHPAATSARASAQRASARLAAGSTWTLERSGAGCESDTFAAHRAFAAVPATSGDQGTFRRAGRLTMTWTAGPAAGDVFNGTWRRKAGGYSGHYTHAGVSDGARLVPVATEGCAVVATAPDEAATVVGASEADTATVTGQDGVTPTGTVHFYVCPGSTGPCDATAAEAVDLGPVPLAGSGSDATATSPAYWPTATGDDCFLAVYSGDGHYGQASDDTSADECFTVGPALVPGPPIGLTALNKVGPHEILAGGTGQFVVAGDIDLNTDVKGQPWSGTFTDPRTGTTWEWDDAIDAKTGSSIDVYGTIHSSNASPSGNPLWPLDTCFEPNAFGEGDPGSPSTPYQPGDPAAGLPTNQVSCSEYGGSVNVDYDNIDPTASQVDDPMQSAGAPPDPMSASTDIACPGAATQINPPMTVTGGVSELTPGEYTTPVEISGSATFADCPGGATGIYRFDQGLWIDPQSAGQTVTGTNIVITTGSPFPVAGNVPGSGTGATFVPSGAGNGAPCLPAGTMTSAENGHGTPQSEVSANQCGGTSPATYGVIGYGDSSFEPDPAETGTGSNYSLIIGGAAGTTVSLTGASTGIYGGNDDTPGIVLYQDPGTQANDGFDAEAGDAAAITVNGVVYNASLTDYGASSPLDYWDGLGGAIPFYAGGTLQAGDGTGWSNGPPQSAGSVTISGTTVVDDYNTDGSTDVTILGRPYQWLVGSSSAARRTTALHERRRSS